MATADYELAADDETVHYEWDATLDPVLTVEPGSVVEFACRDANDGQLGPDSTIEDFLHTDPRPGHPLTGPVAVEGAEPGDVLEIEFLGFEDDGWGYTGFAPGERGKGLLPEEFPEPGFHVWHVEDAVAHFANGIEVPAHPFPGIAGVAPAATGTHSTMPPRDVGGNVDVKHLTEGSTLYLPVEVAGALFSTGDCHVAQGDGEVCVTGIEAPMTVRARLDVRRNRSIDQPELHSAGPYTPSGHDEPQYGTTGIAPDLMDATKQAVRHMIDHLVAERGLTRAEAYILCSAAVDLKVSEVVDAPNWTVTAYVADSLFPDP